MSIKITLPFGNKDNVKDLVFSILSKEYPLRIIDLMNFIRKRYGKSITFQAVRKAVLSLKSEGILINKENKYLIDKEWVRKSKELLETLSRELNRESAAPREIESIEGEISVFEFNSVNEMMKFWQDLIDDWSKNFKKGKDNINGYQAAHAWEGLLHLDREKELMSQLKKKGIKSYILSTGNKALDKSIKKFYESIGINFLIDVSTSSFDKGYYVGTYSDMIIQTQYPENVVKDLDNFFKKNKSIKNFNLKELSDIVNRKNKIKLTVIKNLEMAKQINKSILKSFE